MIRRPPKSTPFPSPMLSRSPQTANVTAALRGHYLLRRRAGGDPFAGKHIATHVLNAGFRDIQTHARYRPDMPYRDLAKYIEDRKSTRLNSSHSQISYAVFCL